MVVIGSKCKEVLPQAGSDVSTGSGAAALVLGT